MLTDLLINSILLFGLIFIYEALNFRPNEKNITKIIVAGLLIGFFTVMIMSNPWQYEVSETEMIFYDTRSVILSVAAAFFSPITAAIAMVISVIYRVWIGGSGAIAGVLSIVTSTGLGILWHILRKRKRLVKVGYEFLIFGVMVHVIVILCQLALPWPKAFVVIQVIALPYLLLYPTVEALLAIAIQNQIDRLDASDRIRRSKIILQASLESPRNLIMCSLDTNYNYLTYNQSHAHFFETEFGIDVSKENNFLSGIQDVDFRTKTEALFVNILKGDSINTVYSCKKCPFHKWIDIAMNPIRDDQGEIVGITLFGQDITEQRRKEEEILYISYHDFLTGLYNRRYFSEYVELIHIDQLPMTYIVADINGLKLTNDAFGHHFGDELISIIAQSLKDHFRPQDVVCRSGGDEFVVAMPNTTREQALEIIDIIKKDLYDNHFNGMSITVSFGVNTMTELGKSVFSMKQAEIEMYRNKLFESSSDRSETIKAILATLYVKNPREENHSRRVSELCVLMGEHLGMGIDDIKQLRVMGNLHDIGKIAIDETILNKPGKLTADEWEQIKRHPEIGYRILSASTDYAEMAEDILSHHERWDGTGYPQGLKTIKIPKRSRIVALADAFDAMTEQRTYRNTLTQAEALNEIRTHAGTQFDPDLAIEFIDMINKNFPEPV